MSMNKVYRLHRLKKNNFVEYTLNFLNSAACKNAYLQCTYTYTMGIEYCSTLALKDCKNILCKSFVTNQALLYPLLKSLSTSSNSTI